MDAHPRPAQRPLPIVVGGHTPAAFRRAVTRGHGWYGFSLDEGNVARCLDGLRAAAETEARPAALGPLEITVTPRGRLTPERVAAFAELGVHRLVPTAAPSAGADEVRATIAAARQAVDG
jgi:alkanesulfonate monooxygenase SsuD/methylene tetrahydromethanopterin reductase-like flavin-dependent oxidoreductase (luciferase family)